MSNDLGASVRARLLNIAKAQSADFNQVLVRFALERLLYRISQSAHRDRFLLKGALLFTLWYDMPHRPTRDADLLGFGPSDPESVRNTFREIASIAVDDGIHFDPNSVAVEAIRPDAAYGGVRLVITGVLAKAICKTQIGIGFGDAVTPSPIEAVYPVLLHDLPAPRLRTYPTYTVVSEKLHAITLLGMTNTRMKDYLDLSILLERETMDVNIPANAIAATFERREMTVPTDTPIGLTDAFANDPSRQSLWLAFLKKNGLKVTPLPAIVTNLRGALQPALAHAAGLVFQSDKNGH